MARANIIISAALALGLAACSTVQENPNYQYSTKYQGAADTSYASNGATTTAASYSTQPTSQTYQNQAYQDQAYQGQTYQGYSTAQAEQQDCRRKESNREIIGGAAGGTLGAIAGKKLIGGTAGTIAGAVAGGVAGYGIGDISVDCSPSVAPAPAQAYQAAPVQSYSPDAPTDTQYAGQDVTGTPGYEIFQNENVSPVTGSSVNPSTVTISGPIHSASSTYPANVPPQNLTNGAVEVTNYDYSANLISADTPIDSASYPADETRILSGIPVFQSYTVQPGDTVYGLSRKLCVGVADIQQHNNISANYGINIGQTIQLPQNRC